MHRQEVCLCDLRPMNTAPNVTVPYYACFLFSLMDISEIYLSLRTGLMQAECRLPYMHKSTFPIGVTMKDVLTYGFWKVSAAD